MADGVTPGIRDAAPICEFKIEEIEWINEWISQRKRWKFMKCRNQNWIQFSIFKDLQIKPNEWMNKWMNKWKNKWMNNWVNKWMNNLE